MSEDDHHLEENPIGEPAPAGDTPPVPSLVSSARIVYCTNCGCQLDGMRIGEPCPNCQVPVGGAAATGAKSNGKAVAALVLGICSFVGCFFYGLPGIVCGILAISFGNKVRRGVAAGEIHASALGMGNAGRVCGIIGLCVSIAYMLAIIGMYVFLFTWMVPQQQQLQQQQMNQLQQQMNQQTQMQQTFPMPAQPVQPAFPPDTDESETTNP